MRSLVQFYYSSNALHVLAVAVLVKSKNCENESIFCSELMNHELSFIYRS